MFKRLLIPLDGSPQSEQVLLLAAQIARQTKGTLILLHVLSLASEYWPVISVPYGIPPDILESEKAETMVYLQTIAAREDLAGIPTELAVRFGAVAPVLLEEARTRHADLILMGRHTSTGVVRFIMGSVSDRVVKHASIPTLVVHEQSEYGTEEYDPLMDGQPGHMSNPLRVLVPLDGSSHAEAVLEPVADFLSVSGALGRNIAVHLLQVVQPGSDEPFQKKLADAKQYLQVLTSMLREGIQAPALAQYHARITWSVASGEDIANTIVQMAETGEGTPGSEAVEPCQFIAIATHGRGAFQRWMMGSVAERVLHLSTRPLLVVRPPSSLEIPSRICQESLSPGNPQER